MTGEIAWDVAGLQQLTYAPGPVARNWFGEATQPWPGPEWLNGIHGSRLGPTVNERTSSDGTVRVAADAEMGVSSWR